MQPRTPAAPRRCQSWRRAVHHVGDERCTTWARRVCAARARTDRVAMRGNARRYVHMGARRVTRAAMRARTSKRLAASSSMRFRNTPRTSRCAPPKHDAATCPWHAGHAAVRRGGTACGAAALPLRGPRHDTRPPPALPSRRAGARSIWFDAARVRTQFVGLTFTRFVVPVSGSYTRCAAPASVPVHSAACERHARGATASSVRAGPAGRRRPPSLSLPARLRNPASPARPCWRSSSAAAAHGAAPSSSWTGPCLLPAPSVPASQTCPPAWCPTASGTRLAPPPAPRRRERRGTQHGHAREGSRRVQSRPQAYA